MYLAIPGEKALIWSLSRSIPVRGSARILSMWYNNQGEGGSSLPSFNEGNMRMRKNVCFTLPPDVLEMLEQLAEKETLGNRSMMITILILRAYGGEESNGAKI